MASSPALLALPVAGMHGLDSTLGPSSGLRTLLPVNGELSVLEIPAGASPGLGQLVL